MRETKGRCRQCGKIYLWMGAPKLMHAYCGRCAIPLERCRNLDRGEKVLQAPVAAS